MSRKCAEQPLLDGSRAKNALVLSSTVVFEVEAKVEAAVEAVGTEKAPTVEEVLVLALVGRCGVQYARSLLGSVG